MEEPWIIIIFQIPATFSFPSRGPMLRMKCFNSREVETGRRLVGSREEGQTWLTPRALGILRRKKGFISSSPPHPVFHPSLSPAPPPSEAPRGIKTDLTSACHCTLQHCCWAKHPLSGSWRSVRCWIVFRLWDAKKTKLNVHVGRVVEVYYSHSQDHNFKLATRRE